jgi:glutamate-1-semialdehyde 2,1-aminomutase
MEKVAPLGPVYQAGTLSGNPVAVSAALATLDRLDDALYTKLESLGARLQKGFEDALKKHAVTGCVQRVGSMLTLFFREGPVRSWDDAKTSDTKSFGAWHTRMREKGVYWPPSQFEAAFLSNAHTETDIDATVRACDDALART